MHKVLSSEDTLLRKLKGAPVKKAHREALRQHEDRKMPGQSLFDWNERPQARTAYMNLFQIPNPQKLPEMIKLLLLF